MINSKEIRSVFLVILLLTLAIGLFKGISSFIYIFIAVFGVILINILAKKIMSFYLDSEIELKIWEWKRYGFEAHQYFKKKIPIGVLLPIIISIISFGRLIWMACLTFDVKPKQYRAAKRHGLYSYSEMSEEHIGLIAGAGVFANLLFALVGYLIGFLEFSRLGLYLAFFNMLPISELDGNKILFGNKVLWVFLATLTLIGLGYVFFTI